jgi:hypothetical protein
MLADELDLSARRTTRPARRPVREVVRAGESVDGDLPNGAVAVTVSDRSSARLLGELSQ